jgi:hypothetical protein
MNYHQQALILGGFMLVIGAIMLVFAAAQAKVYDFNGTEVLPVQLANKIASGTIEVSVIAFVGLGLILIGTLATFAAPQTLIQSQIMSSALFPTLEDLSLIVESTAMGGRVRHIPKVILGGESQVLLAFSQELRGDFESPVEAGGLAWTKARKVLKPIGIALMSEYESILKRDFLELDAQQLSRLLAKAIVTELQLSSGFSLREVTSGHIEATWTKPTIPHTCTAIESKSHPELCYLCSSVACALAKATGKPIWIESSDRLETESGILTKYRVIDA